MELLDSIIFPWWAWFPLFPVNCLLCGSFPCLFWYLFLARLFWICSDHAGFRGQSNSDSLGIPSLALILLGFSRSFSVHGFLAFFLSFSGQKEFFHARTLFCSYTHCLACTYLQTANTGTYINSLSVFFQTSMNVLPESVFICSFSRTFRWLLFIFCPNLYDKCSVGQWEWWSSCRILASHTQKWSLSHSSNAVLNKKRWCILSNPFSEFMDMIMFFVINFTYLINCY